MSARNRGASDNIDGMMNEILDALDLIKTKMPNGEIKVIQEKIESIESSQDDIREDLRMIKKQLLDPEDGVVVRVNKNTEFRKRTETATKEYIKMMDEHREMMSWKETVTRILWILFTSVVGIIFSLIFTRIK